MIDIKAVLDEAVRYYTSLKTICKKELSSLPKGSLSSFCVSGHRYFFITSSCKRKYMGKGNEEVDLLISRHFYENYLKQIESNLSCCREALVSIIPDDPAILASTFSNSYKDLPDECFSKLGFLPPDATGCKESQNPFHPEHLIHITSTGIRMRSKSEVLIANHYTALGHEYAYEMPLTFPDGETIYPDFTIRNNTGTRFLFHEHCGMMTDSNYRKSFFHRLNKYIQFNYLPFRDVLFTFDESDGSIDLNTISREISFFLDQ